MVVDVKSDLVLFVDPSVVNVCAPVTGLNQAMHYQDHAVAIDDMQMQLNSRETLYQTYNPKIYYLQIKKGGEMVTFRKFD